MVRTHGSESTIGAGADVGRSPSCDPARRWARAAGSGVRRDQERRHRRRQQVPHLTYVGDADIGEESNIGAASVFVNYDGRTKHRTRIGSHVRTGSDTMFVAPVTVGDGAYTGAGTVRATTLPRARWRFGQRPAHHRRLGGTQTAEHRRPRRAPGPQQAD